MYDTPEWEEVRARNGWENIHNLEMIFNLLGGSRKRNGNFDEKAWFSVKI